MNGTTSGDSGKDRFTHSRRRGSRFASYNTPICTYSVQNYTALAYPDFLSSSIIYFQLCLHFMFSTLLLFHIFSAQLQRFSDAPHRLRRQIIAQSWSGLLRIVVGGSKSKDDFLTNCCAMPPMFLT